MVTRQNDYNNYAAIPLTVQSVKCGVSNQVFTKEVYLGIPVIGNNTQILNLDIPSLSLYEDEYCEQVSVRFDIGSPSIFEYDKIEM